MTPPPDTPIPAGADRCSESELHARRESLRLGLRRANLASVLILVVVVLLATALVWKARESSIQAERASENALRASSEADRAQRATERAEAELWNSRLNEVRAERYATRPGALIENRRRLSELVRRPDLNEEQRLALRQEAVAQLASMDIELPGQSVTNRSDLALTWNGTLDRYLLWRKDGAVEVFEHPSGKRVAELSGATRAQPHVGVFSLDGRFLAVRFHGGEVQVWDLASTNLLLTTRCVRVPNHPGPLLFSPDSRWLGMFTADGFAVQAMEAGSAPRVLQTGRAIDAAAFTTDGKVLAALPLDDLSVVEIWDVASDTVTQRFKPDVRPEGVEWHLDGRRLALSGSRGQMTLSEIRPAMGNESASPRDSVRFVGHLGTIVFFQFTPDGSKLLTQSWDTTSRFWDVVSGRELFRETRLSLSGISSTGDRLVGTTPDGKRELICRLAAETGFRTFASARIPKAAQGVWLSPDGRLLAIGYPPSQEEKVGEVRLWDFARRIELARVPGIWSQFSPDSRTLYAFEFGSLRRYDVSAAVLSNPPTNWAAGELLYKPDRGVKLNTGQISHDGRALTIAAMDRVIQIEAESGRVTGGFKAPAHYVSASRDGRLITTMFQNQSAEVRDAATGRSLKKSRVFGRGVCSPDANWVAMAEHDGVQVLRCPSLEKAFESPLDLGAITPPPIAFSPDSRILAVAYSRTEIRLHEIPTGRVLAVLSPPDPSQIAGGHGIEFSSDGRWLLFARDGGDVVGWDLQTVRTHLTSLGLDWDTTNAVASDAKPEPLLSPVSVAGPQSVNARRSRAQTRFGVEVVVLVATIVTLLGGVFVFVIQRRLLRSYESAEALAVEQRRRLDSAQAELVHGQKMRALGTLAAGIAHDFNNLLSVIRLSNQLAAEQTRPTGLAKENVDAIETAVGQGESIVHSMLGYSRAAGEQESVYQVDLVAHETVAMLGRKFLAGIILKLEIAESLPPVRGSRGRLEQVLLNLIVNASEAMNGRGTLSLVVRVSRELPGCLLVPRRAERYVEVAVGDSGPGIAPEVMSRMFEPFFTTKTLGTRPGTGLGLATVYTIAEQDGLGLAVSTAPGLGTTFRIFVAVDEASMIAR